MSNNVILENWRLYNTEEGLNKIANENKNFAFVYWVIYIIVSFFLIYTSKQTNLDLAIFLLLSFLSFRGKIKKIAEAKVNRTSDYQGFGDSKKLYLWLCGVLNIKDYEDFEKISVIVWGIFPKVGVFKYVIKIIFIFVLDFIFTYFFGFNLFIYVFIPLYVASLYSWIDGGYKYAWGTTESAVKGDIFSFFMPKWRCARS